MEGTGDVVAGDAPTSLCPWLARIRSPSQDSAPVNSSGCVGRSRESKRVP